VAVITVGSEAIDRASLFASSYTGVVNGNPANAAGIIHTVEVYMQAAGSIDVAMFYVVSGNYLSTRSDITLNGLVAGFNRVTGLSLAVQAGDFIGVHPLSAASIDMDEVGSPLWYRTLDWIPCTNYVFNVGGERTISLKGIGSTLPYVISLTPDLGAASSAVTIGGLGFGASQGTGSVTFNGVAATDITSWSDTEIVCKVPAGATTGNVVVTNNDGDATAGTLFTVAAMDSVWQRFLRNKKVLCIS
jgi:hypothetical protein